MSKTIGLFLRFQETEAETFFHFCASIAVALHYPKYLWSLPFHYKLVDKAQEACAAPSTEDSIIYDKFKGTRVGTRGCSLVK